MGSLDQATIILMLVAFIGGLLTGIILLGPRAYRY